MGYVIQVSADGYRPYGVAAEVMYDQSPEVMLCGPAETGKTLATLNRLHAVACKYAHAHLAMVRKTQKSMYATVIRTYQEKVLPSSRCGVVPYGGKKPEWFDYPNGSRIVVAGMDNPDKLLSGEFDMVLVNQAEELALDEWEKLSTRTTGRAGHMPYAQLLGDCNPGPSTHWILERAKGSMVLWNSRHRDNPMLYDPVTGEMTEQGARSMASLGRLTGVRRGRLFEGKWLSAEGQVYEEFNPDVHLIDSFKIPADWRRICAVDFGYTHPFVCQWWALDGDERMYLYREIYMSGRTVKRHAEQMNRLSGNEWIDVAVCDHDAEDRATLRENGISNQAARKSVSAGIDLVKERLAVQADGRPRLFILRDCLVEVDRRLASERLPTCTAEEFDSYVWSKKSQREQPVKEFDHGMDAMRYAVMALDHGGMSGGRADISEFL